MKDNKLIAEFAGRVHASTIDLHESSPPEGTWIVEEDLKYHSSWEWLMPVGKKCADAINDILKSDKYDENIDIRRKLLAFGDNISIAAGEFDLEKLYKIIVEFIKWYNKNK